MDFDFEGVDLKVETKPSDSGVRKPTRKPRKKRPNLLLKVIFGLAVLVGISSVVIFKML